MNQIQMQLCNTPISTLYPHINNDIEYGLFEDVINYII